MRLTTLFLAISLLVMSAPAQTKKRSAEGDAEIRATLERLYAAWSDRDPSKAAPFYAKDSELAFCDVTPMKYAGWSEYAPEFRRLSRPTASQSSP